MFFMPTPILRKGACVDLPEEQKEWFFTESGWGKALKVCNADDGCPAKDACLALALQEEAVGDKRYGVFGGMSAAARTKKFG